MFPPFGCKNEILVSLIGVNVKPRVCPVLLNQGVDEVTEVAEHGFLADLLDRLPMLIAAVRDERTVHMPRDGEEASCARVHRVEVPDDRIRGARVEDGGAHDYTARRLGGGAVAAGERQQ